MVEAGKAWLLADLMSSGALEAFRVDWAMAVDAHLVDHSFASEVYSFPQAEDHSAAMAVETVVLEEMLPAWAVHRMGDAQPFVD